MNFKIDEEKVFNLAKGMGLTISFGSKNPGVTIISDGKKERKDYTGFFPELKSES